MSLGVSRDFSFKGEHPRAGLVTPRVDRGFAWEQVSPLLARRFPWALGNLEIPNVF